MTGAEFRRIRVDILELTQRQLAVALDSDPSYLGRMERRAHVPVKLAQRLVAYAQLAICPACGQLLPHPKNGEPRP